ncbi:response regulator transcription factor [Bifidobacterium sp. SO4]|uniref:response regulator transcription factor n=1 Tax=Bifidobacterium sp. SO4 TaxID=2809030 RepID=UPI0032048129
MTTIGIVDNDRFALTMLAQTVGRVMAGMRVLWAVESGAQALHHCLYEGGQAVPDVLLLDMSLTDIPGPDVCRRIREAQDRPAILCITSYSLDHYRRPAIDAGAQGLIAKSVTPRELAEAIVTVAQGDVIGDGFMTVADARAALASVRQPDAGLSDREREVLRLYSENFSTEEIATKLGIKASTVFVVMKHAKTKLGASTRSEAIREFLAHQV